jgi:hypothetical protein
VRNVNGPSLKADRCLALLLVAVLALALPWRLHAQDAGQTDAGQTTAPPATDTGQVVPAEPTPVPPVAPAPELPDRPAATAPPSTSEPTSMQPPSAQPPPGTEPPAALAAEPAAEPDSKYVTRPAFLATPPVIDGKLDDAVWQTATRLGDFRQVEPRELEPATEPTDVYLGFDRDNLYIGVRCHDSEASKIVTTTLTRDSDMTYEDTIQILLDTYHDGRNAFLFTTNSGGVLVDGLVRNEGEQVNLDWDGIWSVQSSRDEGGWNAEIAIPWRTLRFPNKPEQEWGFNIERLVARKQERTYWRAFKKTWYYLYKLSEAGTLVGLEGARPGGRFQYSPYITVGAERRQDDDSTSGITEVGGDVKVSLASDLVADLTVNPDFSETEADQQDVNLTRNPLLFPEKRPFFLEGASVFYVGQRPDPEHASEYFLFHSRQIGLAGGGLATIPILGGVKLTGHEKGYDIGVLSLQTNDLRQSDGYGGLIDEPRTTYSVGRVKRTTGNGSTFGLLALSKDASGHYNRVGAADWDIAFSKNFRSGGYLAKSSTPDVEENDWMGSSNIYWDSRHFRFHYEYTDMGEGFNDELGFFSRTAIRLFRTDNFIILWPERGPFKLVWFTVDMDYVEDRATGRLQSRFGHLQYNSYFKSSAGFAYKWYDQTEVLTSPFEISKGVVIPPGSYHFNYHFFGFQSDYTKPLGTVGRVSWGDYYDGTFLQTFGYFAYRPIPGFFLAATYQHTEVKLKEGEFDSDIYLAEFTYAFSPRFSVRSWLQWAPDANLRTKLDVSWELKQGTKFFIVYQDIKTYIDFFNPRQPLFGTPGRSLIAKTVFLF